MSAQPTPGPWSVGGKYAYKSVLLNARGESIASGGNNRAVQGPELEASLVLASAAPDLLAACIRLLGLFDRERCQEVKEDLDAAAAAISKATGGQA